MGLWYSIRRTNGRAPEQSQSCCGPIYDRVLSGLNRHSGRIISTRSHKNELLADLYNLVRISLFAAL